MSFSLIPTPHFEKDLKKLSKKYKSIKVDLLALGERLSQNPFIGNALGNDCFKVRMAISDKKKGKSAGARIIIQVKILNQKVYLLSIYDKSQKADLSSGELEQLLSDLI